MSFEHALRIVEDDQSLSAHEARGAFDDIFGGNVPSDQLATFLLSLCKKGETVDEILGAAQSMRAHAITIKAPPDTIDIVGTGGDNHQTLNVSTAVALVVAACGVPVAKHGNRAATSRSGSSDVLKALGVNLEPGFETLEQCLHEANLCFLFAPSHHLAMRHVADVRRKLGVHTIFNLLGPLTNPANVKRHLIGAYELELLGPMAEVLVRLGSEAAWLAHGQDGMDEITITAPTDIVEMNRGMISHFTLTPEDLGFPRVHISELHGSDAEYNATQLQRLLRGLLSPYRDIVLMNASAALVVAKKAADLSHGVQLAMQAINSGAANNTLDKVIRLTNKSFT
jgi:anthranilate phosphoribosyltransferase